MAAFICVTLLTRNFIPISLFTSVDIVRLIQALFLVKDKSLKVGKMKPICNSSNLNEQLGTI